jgi:putative GTP pyrophosphokinase
MVLVTDEYRNRIRTFYINNVAGFKKALRIIKALLENLADDETLFIDNIEVRLKTIDSLIEKCILKNISPEDVDTFIRDIAGARIIVKYLDMIPVVVSRLRGLNGLVIRGFKDYLNNPKENGYKGYHLYTEVIVDGNIPVPVEIQIRTMGQDLWASIEHELRYKPTCTEECTDNMTDEEKKIFEETKKEEEEKRNEAFRLISEKLSQIDEEVIRLRKSCEPVKSFVKLSTNVNTEALKSSDAAHAATTAGVC